MQLGRSAASPSPWAPCAWSGFGRTSRIGRIGHTLHSCHDLVTCGHLTILTRSHWLLAKFPASISSWGPFSFSFSASPRSWKSAANQHIANIWYWGKVHPLPPYRPRRIPLNNHPIRGMSWFQLSRCLPAPRLLAAIVAIDTSLKDLKFKLSCFSMLTLNISTLLSNTVLIAVPKLLI